VFILILVLISLPVSALIVINIAQKYCLERLPEYLRTWDFLPLPLRSLEPYDKFIVNYLCCLDCCQNIVSNKSEIIENVEFVRSNMQRHHKTENTRRVIRFSETIENDENVTDEPKEVKRRQMEIIVDNDDDSDHYYDKRRAIQDDRQFSDEEQKATDSKIDELYEQVKRDSSENKTVDADEEQAVQQNESRSKTPPYFTNLSYETEKF
jgi:hypothetical protein